MAKKQKKAVQLQLTPESYIKTKARTLEIDRCYVNGDWQEQGMANVIVVRQHPKGTFTVGGYLVDTFCRGVINCFYSFSIDESELEDSVLCHARLAYEDCWQEVDYTTAHNIVYGGLEYAADLGIAPHEDWAIAKYILEEDNDDVPLIDFEFGKNGRPLLCTMSNLEAIRYITILDKTIGRGNYDVIVKGIDDFDDEDCDEDDFDEDFDGEYLDDNEYTADITNELLESVHNMSVAQEDLYHAVALVYANSSKDASKEMKQYADLVFKDDVRATELHNAHVNAVISLGEAIKAYRNDEEFDTEKMEQTTAFIVYAQVTCDLIRELSDKEAKKYLSSNESISDFLNLCDEEVGRRADKLRQELS